MLVVRRCACAVIHVTGGLRHVCSFSISVALLFSGLSVASGQTDKSDPRAVTLLNASVRAMGSIPAVRDLETLMSGKVGPALSDDASQVTAVTIKTKGPRAVSDGSEQQGKDEKRALTVDPNLRNRRLNHIPALLLSYELKRSDVYVEYLGVESLDGRATHRIAISRLSTTGTDMDERRTHDSRMELFIDAETALVVKTRQNLISMTDARRSLPLEIKYADYRRVNGVLVPFSQTTLLNGHPVSELKVESVVFNTGS